MLRRFGCLLCAAIDPGLPPGPRARPRASRGSPASTLLPDTTSPSPRAQSATTSTRARARARGQLAACAVLAERGSTVRQVGRFPPLDFESVLLDMSEDAI